MVKASRRGNRVRKPQIPLAELRAIVRDIGRLPGWDEKDTQAALVMLAPYSIGVRDPVSISHFTKIPLRLVTEFTQRLEDKGIWLPPDEVEVEADWLNPEYGVGAIALDAWVASGKLEREWRLFPEMARRALALH
jgi:hypothetical protein